MPPDSHPLQTIEVQLLLAISLFVIISWPVITQGSFTVAEIYYYIFSTWCILPLLQLLITRKSDW